MLRSSAQVTLTKSVKVGQVCACFNLRKAARAVTQLYEEVLRPSGLRGTQFALLVATKTLEPVTVKRLAKAMVMDRTTLTRDLKPLEKQGLLTVEVGEDRRERKVTLTLQGQQVLARALPLWEKAQARIEKGLGQERLQRLLTDLSAAVAVTKT
jgi:DNA-binding MarR family transcriptional regulator